MKKSMFSQVTMDSILFSSYVGHHRQIAVEAELWVFDGLGFPRGDEERGCKTEPGPYGTTIVRRFGGYRGFCMKCQREGNFYGPRYRSRHKRRA
jgi:hypothetical protein